MNYENILRIPISKLITTSYMEIPQVCNNEKLVNSDGQWRQIR